MAKAHPKDESNPKNEQSRLDQLKAQAKAKGNELYDRANENWKDFWNGPKWGQTHLGGMARQGLAELRAGFYPDSNVAQPTDYGIYGRATPGETADLRREEPNQRDGNEEKQLPAEPQVTVHGESTPKTQEVSKEPTEEKTTSWGSKLQQRTQELSAREAYEPERDDIEPER
jgi:hypothetical protein